MRPEQVTQVMHDPLAQELLHSAIPARMGYNGTDGNPRVIPVGFLWKNKRIVVCTASNAYKVKGLAANPKVALTIDTDAQPYRALLVRGTARVWRSSRACPPSTWKRPGRALTTSSSFGRSRGGGALALQADGAHLHRAGVGEGVGFRDQATECRGAAHEPG